MSLFFVFVVVDDREGTADFRVSKRRCALALDGAKWRTLENRPKTARRGGQATLGPEEAGVGRSAIYFGKEPRPHQRLVQISAATTQRRRGEDGRRTRRTSKTGKRPTDTGRRQTPRRSHRQGRWPFVEKCSENPHGRSSLLDGFSTRAIGADRLA
jgi:hypothetical protein